MSPARTAGVIAIALLAATARPAAADPNDLVLSRLGTLIEDGGGNPVDVIGSNQDFRSLVSELGVVLAPHLLTPSDTLGFGGFQFAVDLNYTSVSTDATYWQALEKAPGDGTSGASGMMSTVGIFMRKGMWLPLPSFEIGAGVVHLGDSSMWAAQGYAKFGLHEGFHDLPIPSLAVRGAASRLMGSKDLDLTVASIDISVSKSFGVGGTINLAPYGGWNMLIIVPRSEVIDKTPNVDSLMVPDDIDMNFVFKDQDNITRQRFFLGARMQYYVFAITLEAAFATSGSSVDDRPGTDTVCGDTTEPTSNCDATDQAGAQQTYTLSVGLDF
jgi:hypothetical protein